KTIIYLLKFSSMKTKIFMLWASLLLFTTNMNAQWVVTDPTNLTQGIINSANQIVQTSTTAKNMISNCAPIKVI
ncbi:MAG: DUF4141 domain-containing protein, partial [Dysgonomonas sp.]|uniref:DUF4141 domain-containing protein n=1 Tax=Dysgonomonas sp. TaxID=1891233 RepID=UPI003A885D49